MMMRTNCFKLLDDKGAINNIETLLEQADCKDYGSSRYSNSTGWLKKKEAEYSRCESADSTYELLCIYEDIIDDTRISGFLEDDDLKLIELHIDELEFNYSMLIKEG